MRVEPYSIMRTADKKCCLQRVCRRDIRIGKNKKCTAKVIWGKKNEKRGEGFFYFLRNSHLGKFGVKRSKKHRTTSIMAAKKRQ